MFFSISNINIYTLRSIFSTDTIRYVINGLFLNGIGYLAYLLVTNLGISPLLTVAIFYPLWLIVSFFTHKLFTFKVVKPQNTSKGLITFVTVYFLGYLLNITLIYIFHNLLKFPHQEVQFCSIIIVALFLFCLNKFIVFKIPVDRS